MSELIEDNPTGCLSALRALGRCFKCPSYERWAGTKGSKVCKSRIVSDEYDALVEERQLLRWKIGELTEKIEEL